MVVEVIEKGGDEEMYGCSFEVAVALYRLLNPGWVLKIPATKKPAP
jgi:hypothetical protein